MLPSAPVSSISTSRAGLLPANGVAYTLQVALASWRTMIAERLSQGGFVGYVAIWVVRPIFELTLAMAEFPPVPEFVELQKRLAEALDTEAAELAARPVPGERQLACA